MLRRSWSDCELSLLRKLWAIADEADLLQALPLRSFYAMNHKAQSLGLRRPLVTTRRHRKYVDPLIKELRIERENRRVSRRILAAKIGISATSLAQAELGHVSNVGFTLVRDWAVALGFEIVLRETPTAESIAAIVIPYPDKRRLMGRI